MNEIIKANMPVQFPLDEIVDENKRLARSWMSVEVKDKQGDIIPISAFKKVMNTWMSRGSPIQDIHTNRHVGKGLNWKEAVHPKSNKPAIEIDYQIFNDYDLDDVVWDEIKTNKRKGLSIGGTEKGIGEYVKDEDGTGLARKMQGLELYEISSVHDPANQLALNSAVNFLAKSDSDLPATEFAIGFKLEKSLNKNADTIDISQKVIDNFKIDPKFYTHINQDISKGFAQPTYSSFKECKDAQLKAGHSEPSADRLAKWLMSNKETEDNKDKDKKNVKDNDSPQDKSATTNKQDITRSSDDSINNSEVNTMSDKIKNETTKGETSDNDDRLASLEKSIETIKATLVKMVPEDKEPEPVKNEVVDKIDDSEDDETEKKKADVDEDETKKDEPSSIGQDDIESPPAGEKVNMDNEQDVKLQKMVSTELKKALESVGLNQIKKAITPRPSAPVQSVTKKVIDPALDLLNKARQGKLDKAGMNREIVKMCRANHNTGLKEVLNQ